MTEALGLPPENQVFHPPLNDYQKRELEKLDRCADAWKEVTGLYACECCSLLEVCRDEWDVICDPHNTEAQKRERLLQETSGPQL